jgi:preprotein translocase subunit Sec61beta
MVKTAAATALAALALSGAAAGAANISAPVPARGFDSPPERLLVQYSGSVLFIRAADIGISAEYPNNGTTYAATATFQSAGLLRWFDDTDIQAGNTNPAENLIYQCVACLWIFFEFLSALVDDPEHLG